MMGEMVAIVEMDLVDRISELPEFILHNILSFLDTKEACRAGVLSKRWQEAWSSNPVLNFQPQYFKKGCSLDPFKKYSPDLYDMETLERFVSFIAKTMQRYSAKKYVIRKLYIGFPTVFEGLEAAVDCLDRWVAIAVQNQVQEMEIEILLEDSREYRLPEILFSALSLKVLKCKKVKLPNYGTMKLYSLEHLGLIRSIVDEDMLQRIISFCPLIDLDFRGCGPLGDISVPWMKKVTDKEVSGDFGCKTRHSNINTCALRYLFYLNHYQCPWPFKMNMDALKNLRKLEIVDTDITDDIVSELTSGLAVLETMILSTNSLLKCIKITSISLKKFTIIGCHNLEKATIDAPNLAFFWFNAELKAAPSSINVNGELRPALSITNVQDHCEAHLVAWVQFPDILWFAKLKELLIKTNIFKFLQMYLSYWESDYQFDVDEERLKMIDSRPPYKLREFRMNDTCGCVLEESSLSDFLDALFWSCRPEVLSIPTSFNNEAVELIFDILKEKVHCWKHPLKSIEVEGVNSSSLLSETCEVEIRLKLSW